jgi:hypothetical protein
MINIKGMLVLDASVLGFALDCLQVQAQNSSVKTSLMKNIPCFNFKGPKNARVLELRSCPFHACINGYRER